MSEQGFEKYCTIIFINFQVANDAFNQKLAIQPRLLVERKLKASCKIAVQTILGHTEIAGNEKSNKGSQTAAKKVQFVPVQLK